MTDRSSNVSSALARVFAFWRTGLPRPVLVLQGGNALNYFGSGLILPFEIIYLHAVRAFSTHTAGLVLRGALRKREGSWNANTVQTALALPALLAAGLPRDAEMVERTVAWLESR